jgi:hypothetical protein
VLNIGVVLVGGQYFPTLKFLHQGTVYDYDGKRDADSIKAFALVGTPFFHNRSFGYTFMRLLYPLFRQDLASGIDYVCRFVGSDWAPWYTASTRSGSVHVSHLKYPIRDLTVYLLVFVCRLQEGYKQAKGSPVPPPPTLVESLKKQGKLFIVNDP